MAGEAGQIDVWWFRSGGGAEAAAAALSLLDPEERSHFRRFATVAAAEFFAFRRAARRVILASYLGERPERLRFEEGPSGKPSLVPAAKLGFSASDSGKTGVIAVASAMPIGVDIERMDRPIQARLAEGILSPGERQAWQRASAAERPRLMLETWTAKEALVKGMGIGLDLAAFRQLTLAGKTGRDAWQEVAMGPGLASQGSWHVRRISLGPEDPRTLVASVAAPAPVSVSVMDARGLLSRHEL